MLLNALVISFRFVASTCRMIHFFWSKEVQFFSLSFPYFVEHSENSCAKNRIPNTQSGFFFVPYNNWAEFGDKIGHCTGYWRNDKTGLESMFSTEQKKGVWFSEKRKNGLCSELEGVYPVCDVAEFVE